MRPLLLSAALLAAAASAQTPDIDVAPEDVSVELTVGETTTRAVLIENQGGAPLQFRVRTSGDAGAAVVYAINGYGGTVYGVDPRNGAVLSRARSEVDGLPAFSGGTLYVLSGTTLFTLDPQTGRQTGSVVLLPPGGDGYYYPARDVAAADGQVAVVVRGPEGSRIDRFDPSTGALLGSTPLALDARALAAGPGVFYVTGTDGRAGEVLVTVDAATGARTRTAAFPRTRSIAYSRALGALLALGDGSDRTVRLYDAATGTYLSAFDLPTDDDYGYAYYGGLAADEGAEVSWLSVSPRSGTVRAGAQVGATLTIDAGRVVDGTYTADVIVASNDPDEPEVAIPVTLVAVGAPAVAVRPGAVAFGPAYVGTPLTRRVTVRNPGSDTLAVGAVTVSDDRLAVDASAFALAPGDSLALAVTLTPTGAGPLDAALTLATNVEGAETVVVPVTAGDAFPPVLAVSSDTLSVEGAAGAVATATLAVSNDGDGPLAYRAFAGLTGEAIPARMSGRNVVAGLAPGPAALDGFIQRFSEEPPGPTPLDGPPDSTGGVGAPALNVLVTDEDGNETVDLLAVRGAVEGDSLYLALDFAAFPDQMDFVAVLDLDTDPTTSSYCCSGTIGAEAEVGGYVYRDLYEGGYRGDVRAYQYGEGQSYYGNSFRVDGNSIVVAVPLSALPGLGRAFDFVLQTSGEVYGRPSRYNSDRVPNEGVVAVQSAPWLSVSPRSGAVAAGASAEVALSLDATGLLGGVYEGVVVVEGNGPEVQRETVPVRFEVVGVADAVAAASVDFGTVFVGHPRGRTIEITNAGTDRLLVGSAASSNAAVRAQTQPLDLRPGESGNYSVTVTATEAGDVEATLTFETNDPDGPLVVAVTATAVPPPVAALAAEAVALEVQAGGTAEAVVTLSNTGGSPLTYRARLAAASAAASGAAHEASAWVPESGAAAWAVHAAALARAGGVQAAARPAQAAALPTLFVDPDEGLGVDVVEVRGELLADGRTVALELVFARPVNAYDLDGTLYLDTDRNAQTGSPADIAGVRRALGTDLTVALYGARYGQVYVYRSSGPYVSQYVAATVSGTSLRFDLPLSYVGTGAFDFVGFTYGAGALDVFPNTGVASADTRLTWVAVTPKDGTVAADGAAEMRLSINASGLAPGTYRAVLRVSTNDPARAVMEVPVTVTVVGNVAAEGALPEAFALDPPAPNPTRGRARLSYALPEGAPVQVEVFDAVGRRVAVLDEGPRAAGTHTADLDAAGLPTGVYSIRLRAGAHTAVQRLSVVR